MYNRRRRPHDKDATVGACAACSMQCERAMNGMRAALRRDRVASVRRTAAAAAAAASNAKHVPLTNPIHQWRHYTSR